MPRTIITGTGSYIPSRRVTNDDLAQRCETSDDWIRERTGIEQRYFIEPGQTTSELGGYAARAALEAAGRAPADVDCVIFATLSPDFLFPGCACLVQASLGMKEVPAFDIRNQCSGFLYGLQVADAFVRAGVYRCVLLVGAEVHSTGLDLSPAGRDVAVLFGDGAGAVVLEAGDDGDRGVVTVTLGADGTHATELWCEGPGSARSPVRVTAEMLALGVQYPRMNGKAVFKHAIRHMQSALEGVLASQGLGIDAVDLLIPHQANLRIAEMVVRRLGLPPERAYNNIQRYGNTTAASIPIALDECARQGRLSTGALLGLVAFGSGFTWGAALIRW